jgi:hypothetical protein
MGDYELVYKFCVNDSFVCARMWVCVMRLHDEDQLDQRVS